MALLKKETRPVEALAVARSIEEFDLLIEDLDAEYPGAWSSATLDGAPNAVDQLDLDIVDVLIVAVQQEDESALEPFEAAIAAGKQRGIAVLLVVDEVSPTTMHRLVRGGADDFAPYPMAEGILSETLSRMRERPAAPQAGGGNGGGRNGMILPVYGVAGGVGATTFAVNLAWEMAQAPRKVDRKVCLIDLDLQFGSVATYLDLARREATMQLLAEPEGRDNAAIIDAMASYKNKMSVLTAPPEAVPYEIIEGSDVQQILDAAAATHDFVIVDMPSSLVAWSSVVLEKAETYFTVMEIDIRSAQNMLRFLRALKAEDLPIEKLQYVLNRAPSGMGSGKSRAKRMAESLGIEYNVMLPDGGKAVPSACDQGAPLSETSGSNALRKEIRKVARSLTELADQQKAARV